MCRLTSTTRLFVEKLIQANNRETMEDLYHCPYAQYYDVIRNKQRGNENGLILISKG